MAVKIIDYKELVKDWQDDTVKERLEQLWQAIENHCKTLVDPKIIVNGILAQFFETGDYMGHFEEKPSPRCERAYYERWYISTGIKDNVVLIAHSQGFDAIEFENLDHKDF